MWRCVMASVELHTWTLCCVCLQKPMGINYRAWASFPLEQKSALVLIALNLNIWIVLFSGGCLYWFSLITVILCGVGPRDGGRVTTEVHTHSNCFFGWVTRHNGRFLVTNFHYNLCWEQIFSLVASTNTLQTDCTRSGERLNCSIWKLVEDGPSIWMFQKMLTEYCSFISTKGHSCHTRAVTPRVWR